MIEKQRKPSLPDPQEEWLCKLDAPAPPEVQKNAPEAPKLKPVVLKFDEETAALQNAQAKKDEEAKGQ